MSFFNIVDRLHQLFQGAEFADAQLLLELAFFHVPKHVSVNFELLALDQCPVFLCASPLPFPNIFTASIPEYLVNVVERVAKFLFPFLFDSLVIDFLRLYLKVRGFVSEQSHVFVK